MPSAAAPLPTEEKIASDSRIDWLGNPHAANARQIARTAYNSDRPDVWYKTFADCPAVIEAINARFMEARRMNAINMARTGFAPRCQELIDFVFSIVHTVRVTPALKKMLIADLMAWVANQLRQIGFDTAPVGESSWGVLKVKETKGN